MKPIRRLEWHEVAGVPHGTFKIVLLYIGIAASWLLVANGLAGWLLGGSGLGAGRIFWGGFLLIAGVALWFAWSRRRLARKRAAVSDLPSAVTLERPAISPPVGMTIGEGVWADIINQASRPLLTLPFLVLTVVITALVIIGISYTAHYGRQKEGLRLQAIADLKIDVYKRQARYCPRSSDLYPFFAGTTLIPRTGQRRFSAASVGPGH